MGCQQFHILRFQRGAHGLRSGAQVQQTAFFCSFLNPGIVIAVSVENDALVGGNSLLDQVMERGIKVCGLLQLVCIPAQDLCHSGVQHDVGAGNGVAGPQHPEFKLIAGKGKGRSAVAVCGIPNESGKSRNTQL